MIPPSFSALGVHYLSTGRSRQAAPIALLRIPETRQFPNQTLNFKP
jgi:hypothetical protein